MQDVAGREGECSRALCLDPGPPASPWVCLSREVVAEPTTRQTREKDGLIRSMFSSFKVGRGQGLHSNPHAGVSQVFVGPGGVLQRCIT